MSADFDPLKTARINILHHGLELIAWDMSNEGAEQRNSFFQAIADINIDWVSVKTEAVLAKAQQLILEARERAA